jgi:hypothetical protein
MNARQIAGLVHGRPAGRGKWQAKCPAHEDRNPSLSISEGQNGRVLLKCHAGCELKDILERLGLTVADINGGGGNTSSRQRSKQIQTTYDYRDRNGELIFQVVRYNPKNFMQRRPDGMGGWIWNLEGVPRVLFNLPEVSKADVILIAEGEKDALTLQEAAKYFAVQDGCSYAATTNPGGAGKWHDEYSQSLNGKLGAYIFADNDSPGRKHAQQVLASINPYIKDVRLVDLPGLQPKGDVSVWLREHSVEELWQVMQSAPFSKPPLREEPTALPNEGHTDHMQAAVQDKRPKVRLPGANWLLSQTAAALGQHLADKSLFVRNGEIVTLNGNELRVITPQTFRTWVERYVVCYRRRNPGSNAYDVNITMTDNEASGILASPQFAEKLRPVVRLNLCRQPVLRADGTIELLPNGYDFQSKTLTISSVSYAEAMPLEVAVETINDLFSEFCFVDKARSKAVAIAALVGLYAPQLLPEGSLRPCIIVTKNAEGAGATTLVACSVVPVIGELPTGVKADDEDETRKALTTAVREGRSVVLFDNQKSRLSSASLEAFITAPTWRDRLLGANQTITAPNLATVFVTSNGCTLDPDMRRRSLFVELHLEAERAEDRHFRRTLDQPTLLALRPKILAACWSLIRNWQAQGQPPPTRLHSAFPGWAKAIGGIVEAAGYGCPLDTPACAAAADEVGDSMRVLVGAMQPERKYEFSEIVKLCQDNECFVWLTGGEIDRKARAKLGKLLSQWDKRQVKDLHFLVEGKGHAKRFHTGK